MLIGINVADPEICDGKKIPGYADPRVQLAQARLDAFASTSNYRPGIVRGWRVNQHFREGGKEEKA